MTVQRAAAIAVRRAARDARIARQQAAQRAKDAIRALSLATQRLKSLGRKGARSSWNEMMARCQNQRHKDYPNYGGRGIAVCERWKSFESFYEDMGIRPVGMTIERVDNELGYSPDNCRWATRTEQNRNSRHCKLTAADVVAIRASGERNGLLAAKYGITPENVHAIRTRRTWANV